MRMTRLSGLAAVFVGVAALVTGCGGSEEQRAAQADRALSFSNPRTIDNPYFPLTTRGRRCVMRGVSDEGERERSVLTVLNRTRRFRIGGRPVDALTVLDQAYEGGELVESTLDYYAQADNGTVYYLGEDVRNIANGRVANRRGSWLYGRDTDVPGVAMPADPKLGDQWHFEDVPGITTESNRIEEVGMRLRVGGRLYRDLIRVSEFIQPEGEVEWKIYARGVGILREFDPGGRGEFVGCS
jgi:hypothetical protein